LGGHFGLCLARNAQKQKKRSATKNRSAKSVSPKVNQQIGQGSTETNRSRKSVSKNEKSVSKNEKSVSDATIGQQNQKSVSCGGQPGLRS